MLVIVGYMVVMLTVFGGFALSGGSFAALFQPLELLIIGGAAVGAFIVANNGKAIKATMKAFPHMMQGSHYTKALYMDLIAAMYLLLSKARQTGMISLENDIEDPENSTIFSAYPRLMKDKVLLNFVLDYLRLMVSGSMNSFEMEALMDEEIETLEHEHDVPASALNGVGDGLPAFGIVAAVMGVVNALAAADRPAAELGELIAHAMVGTFLGILLAYGFVLPLASLLRQKSSEQIKMLQCIKVTLLSSLNGYAPQIAVEFGRKILFTTERPSFMELEEHVREVKSSSNSSASSADNAS
ncbi:MAG: flagellar motor stator protein MotA [Hafnia sp.]|uniref:MotA family flagellar motor rotation protein n=1 Tax=Obesumbacterium proteus ATCC 12841 TaxID=1354268 RepID=A0AA91EEM6_9GAMM|nr:flagellar motor stator protein MotA [Obesumbacterium proteus]AMO83554.1 flagellar motor stator protein MotA [Obesumbacterium proteus]KKI43528.1 flagellar motor protein MotA [Obesumbacterium proteus]MCE9883579.1 flagellar motor stator protein MotA [Obesumbacterium proteus]MCE9915180.1 flagellar motor stator protein MotA [Obesumbacterium proteus]MCE9927950.1 flagellar motor stator protein MotA [Obesumbacterium proteus]